MSLLSRIRNVSHNTLFFLVSALLAVTAWMYFLSDGFSSHGLLDAYYEIQAESLRNGQLSLIPGPDDYYYHDVSLYEGRYYFYWGLLPSLIHLMLSTCLPRVLSSYLVTCLFLFSLFFFYQLIIAALFSTSEESRTSRGRQGYQSAFISILAWLAIFILPFPFQSFENQWFFKQFLIYEQAIIFGLGLAMPALYCCLRGLQEKNSSLLLASALVFALAGWVRGTWLVCSVFMIPLLYIQIYKYSLSEQRDNAYRLRMGSVGLVPILLLGGLIALNYIRFDSFFEFGLKLQNPTTQGFLRIINGIFSSETQVWNFLFKIDSYYLSSGFFEDPGWFRKISTGWEGPPPALFRYNPLMLIPTLLVPYGIFQSASRNRPLFNMMIPLVLVTLIINVTIWLFGVMVAMRFFMECYYLLVLLMTAALLATLSCRFSFVIMTIALCLHLPESIYRFTHVTPDIRPVGISRIANRTVDYNCLENAAQCWVFKQPKWHAGTLSNSTRSIMRNYNTLGISLTPEGVFVGDDVCAIYIIPDKEGHVAAGKAAVEFEKIGTLDIPGRLHLYLDGQFIGGLSLHQMGPRNASVEFDSPQKITYPSQLRMVFLPEDAPFLPPRGPSAGAFYFRSIRLSSAYANSS